MKSVQNIINLLAKAKQLELFHKSIAFASERQLQGGGASKAAFGARNRG
jgi:hypothetical protein